MTDESNIEFVGKVKAEKLTTLAEDSKNELAEIWTDWTAVNLGPLLERVFP